MKKITLLLLMLVSLNAYAEWRVVPGSSGMGLLSVVANPNCQPRQDTKQRVSNYVVSVAAFRACKVWIVSVDGFAEAYAVMDNPLNMKAAQDALLQMVQTQGGSDDDVLAKQLKDRNAEAAYKWAKDAKRYGANVDIAYASAKTALSTLDASCPDAIAMKLTPASRYAASQHSYAKIFSHQCGFYVSYEPTNGWIDSNFVQGDVDGWYEFCHKPMGFLDSTCSDGTKEVQHSSDSAN